MDLFFLSWTLQYQLFFIFGFVIIFIVVVAFVNKWFQVRRIRRYHPVETSSATRVARQISYRHQHPVPSAADDSIPAIEVNGIAIDEVDQIEAEDKGRREPLFGTHALQAGQFVRNVTTIRDSIPGFNLTLEEIIAAQEVVNRPVPVARQPSNPKGKGKANQRSPRTHSVELADPPVLSDSEVTSYTREDLPSQTRRPQSIQPQVNPKDVLGRFKPNAKRERPFSTGDLADELVTDFLPKSSNIIVRSSNSSGESHPDSGYDSSARSAADESLTSMEGDSGNDIHIMLDSHRASIVREAGDLNALRNGPIAYMPRRDVRTKQGLEPRRGVSNISDSTSISAQLDQTESTSELSDSNPSSMFQGSFTFVETYRPDAPHNISSALRDSDSDASFKTALSTSPLISRPTTPNHTLEDAIARVIDPAVIKATRNRSRHADRLITAGAEFRVVNKGFAVGHGHRFSHFTEENMEVLPSSDRHETAKRKSVFDLFRAPSRRMTKDPEMGSESEK